MTSMLPKLVSSVQWVATQKIVDDLGLAGFVLNHSKSNLKPQQVGPWLGFQLDLNKGMFYVPEETLSKLIYIIEFVFANWLVL